MSAAASASAHLFQDFSGNFQQRKLLLYNSLNNQKVIASAAAASHPNHGENSFDSNTMTVLLVFLCGLICSIGLAFLIKCSLSCSRSSAASQSSTNSSARFGNKGIKQNVLKTFPVVKYSGELKLPGLDSECIICLSEFAPGEPVRLLPKCNHGFHVRCSDKWFSTHSSCPKCRHCLVETCQNVVGCRQADPSSLAASAAVQETVVIIVPLEPECMTCNYR